MESYVAAARNGYGVARNGYGVAAGQKDGRRALTAFVQQLGRDVQQPACWQHPVAGLAGLL
jgi:hypothetical protein